MLCTALFVFHLDKLGINPHALLKTLLIEQNLNHKEQQAPISIDIPLAQLTCFT